MCGVGTDLGGRSQDRRSGRGADAGRDAETARKLYVLIVARLVFDQSPFGPNVSRIGTLGSSDFSSLVNRPADPVGQICTQDQPK